MPRVLKLNQRRFVKGMSNWEVMAFIALIGGYFYLGFSLYEPIWDRWKIKNIIATTMDEPETLKQSVEATTSKILKRMSVNNIYGVTSKDFKIQQTDKAVRLTFDKSMPVSLAFDINAVVQIKEVIEKKRK